jgi:hypothetical protein
MKSCFFGLMIACLTIGFQVHAQSIPPTTPPQEAIQACDGKTSGDTCSFTGMRNDTVTGTCRNGPDGQGALACAPAQMPGQSQHQGSGQPSAAIQACNGKSMGNSCSFAGPNNQSVSGSCQQGPEASAPLCCK